MPGQQRAGRHPEACPRRAREHATEDGQQGTIGGLVSGTHYLASEYLHFVAQGEELGFLGARAAKEKKHQLEHLSQAEVDEGP
jgi:hypothetical protein